MRVPLKDRFMQCLFIAAFVIPPWNIFWWTVGAVYYAWSGGRKWDTSGDGALGIVLAAPVTLPALPFMLLRERLEARKLKKLEARHQRAAEWIAAHLRRQGVAVSSANGHSFGIDLKAEVPPDKIAAYQHIFAAAIRLFPDVLPAGISWRVSPLAPLDRAWAERQGFAAYAEEITVVCVDCGGKESFGFAFGPERIAGRHDYIEGRHTIGLKGGGTRIVDGHICRRCLDRIGWSSMSSMSRSCVSD